jgi:hypothetical protein
MNDVCGELLAQGLIDQCPDDGGGCNAWNYRTVIQLMSAGVADSEILGIIKELSKRDDPSKLKEETSRHLDRAREYLALDDDDRKKMSRRKRPFAEFDYDCLVGQVDESVDPLEVLEEATHECHNSADFLSMVFGNETACVLRDTRAKRDLFWPAARAKFEDLLEGDDGVFFLNNPVLGKPVDGSWRSKACVTEFRYLVLECDHSEKLYPGISDNWLRYLLTLDLPIKSIVTSGGKSVHALVDLGTRTDSEFEAVACNLHEPLVMSGADPNSLTSVRLTRLPFSYRSSHEATQDLLYVNPNPIGRAIHG